MDREGNTYDREKRQGCYKEKYTTWREGKDAMQDLDKG